MPPELSREQSGSVSTQQAFGRFLMDLAHDAPEAAASVVTVSPDVASSTNLGGWINRAGVWNVGERIDWFADDSDTLVRWRESEHGQHIELGIAEGNLVGLLGELGATWSRDGQPLLPVGTLYDPFVNRALEQWSFGIYAGGQSILVGTPAGVTLAPEGGAHQSIITPSVGPRAAPLRRLGAGIRPGPRVDAARRARSARTRAGNVLLLPAQHRPVEQALARLPAAGPERERRRGQVLRGGYRLHEAAQRARRDDRRARRRAHRGARRRRGARPRRSRSGCDLPHLARPALPRAAGPLPASTRARTRSSPSSSPPRAPARS